MPRGRQAAEYLKGAEWFEGREGGLYKGGVLIIQKAHHKTSILEVCVRLQMSVGVPKRI